MKSEKYRPKKSLGQNFLIEENISRKIVGSLVINPDDLVIEIGAGQGALTKHLHKLNCNLIAYEIDQRAVDYLQKNVSQDLKIINDDIGNINYGQLFKSNGNEKIKIIGNLPYNITSKILFDIFENTQYIDSCVIMIQREVASRLIAKPKTKDYGILTLAMQLLGQTQKQFDVSPQCFYPQPKVTSTVLHLSFSDGLVHDSKEFKSIMKLVKAGFSQRRKKLNNALKSHLDSFGVSKERVEMELGKKIFDKRAEELPVRDFIELHSVINNLGKIK